MEEGQTDTGQHQHHDGAVRLRLYRAVTVTEQVDAVEGAEAVSPAAAPEARPLSFAERSAKGVEARQKKRRAKRPRGRPKLDAAKSTTEQDAAPPEQPPATDLTLPPEVPASRSEAVAQASPVTPIAGRVKGRSSRENTCPYSPAGTVQEYTESDRVL